MISGLGNSLRAALFAAGAVIGLASGAQAQNFSLDGVRFTPSIYLDDAELQATVAPYLDRQITLADVQAMTSDVQRLYTAAGILTARVMLLPQTVTDGVLELTLVEAKIDRLTYEGLDGTDAAFMQRNLSLRAGAAPDYEQLERDLRVFEIVHDFAPHLKFSEGAAFGTVDAIVTGTPPEKNIWVGSVDNYGPVSTGEWRGTLQVNMPNMTGNRDSLFLQAQVSQGAQSIDATYTFPIGGRGGVLYGNANYSMSKIIDGDFAVIDLKSDSLSGTVGYRQPFRIRPQSHWMFDVYATLEQSSSELTALSFQEHDIQEFGAQVSYQLVRNAKSWSASLGIKGGNVDTAETSETEGSYWLAYGTAGHARGLGKNYLLDMALSFQYAYGQNLASPRLFSAGGVTTVRGYPSSVRSGDSGAVLRTQISRWKANDFKGFDGSWTPFAFLDAGVVVPYRDEGGFEADTDLLASIGGGVRVTIKDNITGVAFVSFPLVETEGFSDVGSPVLSVGLDYTF